MFEQGRPALGDAIVGTLGGHCEVCHGWNPGRLCRPCRDRFAAPCHRCDRCALSLPAGVARCGTCLHDPPAFEHCVCAVDYGFPWDRLISRFKFEATPELATMLADLLLEAAKQQSDGLPQMLLPVPLSAQRLALRGYDQAWELTRRLGRQLAVPVQARALTRRFDSRPQARLTRRDRQANLRGAFVVPPAMKDRLSGRHVGLVDDVMTTGATAQEAALALLAAGARRVDLWVVARTAAPGSDD
jgi:ComF family protein